MDEYASLTVYDNDNVALERFEECKAVAREGLLIVVAGNEHHVFNGHAWSRIEGIPLVRV